MCSTPNTEAAETCKNCGARLKPLIVEPGAGDPFEGGGFDEVLGTPEDESSDWIARIRSDVDAGDKSLEGHPEEAAGDDPEWLGALRAADTSGDEGPPEGELPDWMDEFVAAGEEDEAEEQVPEWLERIRARQDASGGAEPADADMGWLDQLRAEEAGPRAEGLEDLAPSPDADEDDSLPGSRPLDLGALSAFPGVPGSPDAPEDQEPSPLPPLDEPFPPGEPLPERPARGTAPIGGRDLSPEEVPAEAEELPHVPALFAEEGGKPPIVAIEDSSLEAIELPDWLGEAAPAAEGDEEEDLEGPDLAPATLPSWLEAMRPVDTFRSEIEIEPEEVQSVEAAGPLAGLRGVLMAEPVVAMPRSSTATAGRLEVTERQFAQAELLHRLVEDEKREATLAKPKARRFPIIQWVIGLILCISVTAPFIFGLFGLGGFATPAVVPRDLGPLINLVESVAPGEPVLVVFDYIPGYGGELDAVAGAIIDHAVARSLPIVSLSTKASGPALAARAISAAGDLTNGEDYIHLGYLPGGPAAVQLFAIAPQNAAPWGFMLPAILEDATAWDSLALDGVTALADFGMVVVITAETDMARVWVEQTHPWIGDTPLVMVLSAGAEPLIRPYFESDEQQVEGILTGLPSAVVYEEYNARSTGARDLWNAFGMGTIAIELILLAGLIYGAVVWVLGRRDQAGAG